MGMTDEARQAWIECYAKSTGACMADATYAWFCLMAEDDDADWPDEEREDEEETD
jgi:hypothetical protein